MTFIETRYMAQVRHFESPFDLDAPGFHHGWWSDPFLRSSNVDLRPYSFIDERGNEIARVLLRADAGFYDPDGAGVALPPRAVSVDLLEVRADLRYPSRGIGTQVVRIVEDLFPDRVIFAFSEDADRFWASTGWEHVPRVDDSRSYRPLFVLTRGVDVLAKPTPRLT